MTPELGRLRIYLDEDVDVLLAPLLAAHGLDSLTTVTASNMSWSDEEQLTFALQESRVIITHNRTDFESLAVTWCGHGSGKTKRTDQFLESPT